MAVLADADLLEEFRNIRRRPRCRWHLEHSRHARFTVCQRARRPAQRGNLALSEQPGLSPGMGPGSVRP